MALTDKLKVAPKINAEAVICNNPLTHMRSHTTAAVLQFVVLYSLLVIPAIEHANGGV